MAGKKVQRSIPKTKSEVVLSKETLEFFLESRIKKEISDHDISLYMILRWFCDDEKVIQLSMGEMQEILKLTRPAIIHKIKKLKKLGLVQTTIRVQTKGQKILNFNSYKKAREYLQDNHGRYRTTQYKLLECGRVN